MELRLYSRDINIAPAKSGHYENVDITKGLCIIWVVMMHLQINPSCIEGAVRMPIFFMISGMFFKPTDNINFLKKRWRSLFFPLLCFWLISWVFKLATEDFPGILKNGQVDWGHIFGFLGEYSYIRINLLWFLMSLFVTSMAFCLLWNVIKSKNRPYILVIISVALFLIGSVLCSKKINCEYFPVWETMIFQLYYVIGALLSRYWKNLQNPVLWILATAVYAYMFYKIPYVPFLVKTIPYTILIFGSMMTIGNVIASYRASWILRYIGASSAVVYLTHMLLMTTDFSKSVIEQHGVDGRWMVFCGIMVIELPLIWLFNRYWPEAIGKRRKSKSIG